MQSRFNHRLGSLMQLLQTLDDYAHRPNVPSPSTHQANACRHPTRRHPPSAAQTTSSPPTSLFDLDHTLLPIELGLYLDDLYQRHRLDRCRAITHLGILPAIQSRPPGYGRIRALSPAPCAPSRTRAVACRARAIWYRYIAHIRQPALDLLAQHRAAVHTLVLTTATVCYIAPPHRAATRLCR